MEQPTANYNLCPFCTQAYPIEQMTPILLSGRNVLVCDGCFGQIERGQPVKPDLVMLQYQLATGAAMEAIDTKFRGMMADIQQQYQEMAVSPISLMSMAAPMAAAAGEGKSREEVLEIFHYFLGELRTVVEHWRRQDEGSRH